MLGLASRLDLLQAELLGQAVERAEDLVENANDALRHRPPCEWREVDHVGKHDGDVVVAFGDDPNLALEPFGDCLGQDVQEQAF